MAECTLFHRQQEVTMKWAMFRHLRVVTITIAVTLFRPNRAGMLAPSKLDK
jgi:hypothetical protein